MQLPENNSLPNIEQALHSIAQAIRPASGVVGIKVATYSAFASGTVTTPVDDTIPQITEGNQFMTIQYTPKNTSNRLLIEVDALLAHSAGVQDIVVALHQDALADAIAAGSYVQGGTTYKHKATLAADIQVPSTNQITFSFRAGSNVAGTLCMNGHPTTRLFGATSKSIIKVTEYVPSA